MEIHNIELNPGNGGQMARGAGNFGTIMAKEDTYSNIKMPSGEVSLQAEDPEFVVATGLLLWGKDRLFADGEGIGVNGWLKQLLKNLLP